MLSVVHKMLKSFTSHSLLCALLMGEDLEQNEGWVMRVTIALQRKEIRG